MENILSLITTENIGIVGTILWCVSEALAEIPTVKANSVFQLAHHVLAKLLGKEIKE